MSLLAGSPRSLALTWEPHPDVWPISPLPELPHSSYRGRTVHIFAHSLLPTEPASFLTYADTASDRRYADAPRMPEWFDLLRDLPAGPWLRCAPPTPTAEATS